MSDRSKLDNCRARNWEKFVFRRVGAFNLKRRLGRRIIVDEKETTAVTIKITRTQTWRRYNKIFVVSSSLEGEARNVSARTSVRDC